MAFFVKSTHRPAGSGKLLKVKRELERDRNGAGRCLLEKHATFRSEPVPIFRNWGLAELDPSHPFAFPVKLFSSAQRLTPGDYTIYANPKNRNFLAENNHWIE